MKRKDVIRLIKRVIAILLIAVMTASVFTSYDKAGQFFNSIRSVFADEIEGEGEGENEDSFIIDTKAPDIVVTEPSYNEEITESDNNINIEDTTDSSETETVETTVFETYPVETEPARKTLSLRSARSKLRVRISSYPVFYPLKFG